MWHKMLLWWLAVLWRFQWATRLQDVVPLLMSAIILRNSKAV